MGGVNSGSWYRWDKQDTVEECRTLDVRHWRRDGVLTPGTSFNITWSRRGQTTAQIGARVEVGRVFLTYRYRRPSASEKILSAP